MPFDTTGMTLVDETQQGFDASDLEPVGSPDVGAAGKAAFGPPGSNLSFPERNTVSPIQVGQPPTLQERVNSALETPSEQALQQRLTTPLVNLPKELYTPPVLAAFAPDIAGAMAERGKAILESFTSPEGAAQLPYMAVGGLEASALKGGAVAARVIGSAFGAQGATQLPEAAHRYIDAISKGDRAEAAKAWVDLAATSVQTLGLAGTLGMKEALSKPPIIDTAPMTTAALRLLPAPGETLRPSTLTEMGEPRRTTLEPPINLPNVEAQPFELVPPERRLPAPSIKLPERMPVFEQPVIPPERQLAGAGIRLPEFQEGIIGPEPRVGPLHESRQLPAPSIKLPESFPGEQGPILTHGAEPGEVIQRISLPIEPESAARIRQVWSKPIDVEAQVTGAEALRSLVSLSEESKTAGQPYKPPTVNVDLRQLEAMMQRNSVSRVESWADETIRGKLRETGANPYFDPEFLAAAAVKAAILVKRGITSFADWSASMKEQFGPGIEEHLKPLFDQATRAYGVTGNERQILREGEQFTPPGFEPPSGGDVVSPIIQSQSASTTERVQSSNRQGVTTLPSGDQQTLGIRFPISLPGLSAIHSAITGGTENARLFLKGVAGESLPRMVAANPEAGEAGVSFASARLAAPLKAELFVQDALRGTGVDPVKFGAALTEDNLRSVREQRIANGEDPADVNVNTVIGKAGSPFATEAAYQRFLADPATQKAIDQYKSTWDAVKDPQFKLAQSIDPATPLPTRGLQTGARINLYGVKAGEPLPTGVRIAGGGGGGNLMATLRRRSPFARKATGESDSYVIDLRDIMAHSMEQEYAIAMKNKMDAALVKNGDAAIVKAGDPAPTLKGEETMRAPYTRLTIKTEDGMVNRNTDLYIRKSLYREYRNLHGTDLPAAGFAKVGEALTRASLVGLSEGTIHVSNLLTGVLTRPGPTSSTLANIGLKVAGRADVPITIANVVRNALTASTRQLTSLAEIGALKEPYQGTLLSPFLNRIDKGVRVTLDNVYQGMKAQGLVEDTPQARREFINQVGQYSKRLQGPIIRTLRESQIGPFATAGRAFNVLGARTAALSPGLKASTAAHALALRAEQIAGIVGIGAIAAAWNYWRTGNVTPPGVRLGDLYLSTEPNGHQNTFGLADALGYGRAMRVTGARGVIEAKRAGLSTAEAIDKGLGDVTSAAISPALGPLPNFVSMAAAGKRANLLLDANAKTEAPRVPPGSPIPQRAANLGYAAIQSNPLAGTAYDIYQGKLPSEIASRQLTRFSPRSAPSADLIEALPRIVTKQRMEDYVDDIARRARKLTPDAAEKLFDSAREAIDNIDDPKLKREGKLRLKGKEKYQ